MSETIVGLDRFHLKRGDLLVGMTGYVGETGLVVSPRHHIELADAILSLLTLPPDTLDKMGVMARERIVCDYDIKKITVAYENCYLLHQGL